jgi:hypothetical protein
MASTVLQSDFTGSTTDLIDNRDIAVRIPLSHATSKNSEMIHPAFFSVDYVGIIPGVRRRILPPQF